MWMRTLVIAIALTLAAGLQPANADGVFVMKQKTNLDPKSHARDITEPVQKALIIHDKGIEQLILQVSYKGNASEFAWLVPTPSRPEVSKVDAPIFHLLHRATAPKVRYWFDADQKIDGFYGKGKATTLSAPGGLDVQVFEEKQVGAYDIAVLRAGNADDLLQWLRSNGYQITPKLVPVASDYIRRGWVFTAMRINTGYQDKVSQRLHKGILQSLKFKFQTTEPVYPLKVSSLNNGKTDILLYIIAAHRVDEPLMTTECSLDYYTSHALFGIEDALLYSPRWPSARLTKLTAELTSKQMTHDLVLKPAGTNSIMPVKDVSPPFLENLGASSLLFLDNVFPYPQSLIVLGFVSLFALSPIGQKRWRIWVAAGIVFVIVGIIADDGMLVQRMASYCQQNGGYGPVGTASLVLLSVPVIGMVLFAVRHRRNFA